MADQALRDEVLTLLVAGVCWARCWTRCYVECMWAGAMVGSAWAMLLALKVAGQGGACLTERCATRCLALLAAGGAPAPALAQATPQLASCHLVSVLPCAGQETSAILLGWACAHHPNALPHCRVCHHSQMYLQAKKPPPSCWAGPVPIWPTTLKPRKQRRQRWPPCCGRGAATAAVTTTAAPAAAAMAMGESWRLQMPAACRWWKL